MSTTPQKPPPFATRRREQVHATLEPTNEILQEFYAEEERLHEEKLAAAGSAGVPTKTVPKNKEAARGCPNRFSILTMLPARRNRSFGLSSHVLVSSST